MTSLHPPLSIVLPVFNAAQYLSSALDSLLNQTFKDFELMIVNDFSSDRTEEIIKEYQRKDSRINYVLNEFQKGLAGALNTGLKHSQGKYIARADGDDLNYPQRLKLQYEFLEKNPTIALVGAGYRAFNEKGVRLKIYHPLQSIELAWRCVSNTPFCHPTVMFRREVVAQAGGYPFQVSEDFGLFSKITQKYPCKNINQILIDYREHPDNYSSKQKDEILENVKAIAKENYKFYLNNLDFFEDFFSFQTKTLCHFKKVPALLKINFKIIKKICQHYSRPLWSLETLQLFVKVFLRLLIASIKGKIK
jgi:glycosyltransferase involved in cell wall biosynthesis